MVIDQELEADRERLSETTNENKLLKSRISKYIEEIADYKRRLEVLKQDINSKDHQLIVLSCSEKELKEQNQELLSKLNSLHNSDGSDGKRLSTRLGTLLGHSKK